MVAIIDIGSNTIRLCIYKIDADGDIRQTYKLKGVVGLAGYVDRKNFLTQEGIAETCATLIRFREALSKMKISETHVFGTASLRNVRNTEQAVKTIKRKTGFDVTVISGEDEALCDFVGATNRTPMTDGLMVDIGGGSTELIICKNGTPEQIMSIPIGSLNMFSRYVARVLPSKAQAEKIRLDATAKLAAFKSKRLPMICGVGGTMRGLYKLNNALFDEPPENRVVGAKNVKKILSLIDTDTHMMVGKILRISPERIHTITPGLIILSALIKKYGCKTIAVSESGVREGYLIRNVLHRDIKKPGTPVALVARNKITGDYDNQHSSHKKGSNANARR